MKSIILSAILIVLAGCNVEKRFQKQKKKATEFFLLNRPDLAELCEREFPDVPFKVIPGDTITKTDTLFVPGPKLVCSDSIVLDCPPSKIIKDTKIVKDSILVKDTGEIFLLNFQIGKINAEKESIKKLLDENKESLRESDNKKTQWFWMLITLAVANFIYFGMKIYLKFAKP